MCESLDKNLKEYMDIKIGDVVSLTNDGLNFIKDLLTELNDDFIDDIFKHGKFKVTKIKQEGVCEEGDNDTCVCNKYFKLEGIKLNCFMYHEIDLFKGVK